ncbi:hypothetical protein CIPAW_01G059600 [Carya illinoinensis]|uniref:Secreted protein n=1 Tax=Carya illinoinensis TaxID=32201 RepID=A0A8T1RIV1_CARIL|nr:hypothetical protein CIPAW_01G059600 [Carya illinoinensis]
MGFCLVCHLRLFALRGVPSPIPHLATEKVMCSDFHCHGSKTNSESHKQNLLLQSISLNSRLEKHKS